MRRLTIIFLSGLGGLALVIALLWVGLFYTPPGRQLLEEIVERELGGALNSKSDIGSLSGALPGEIFVDGVTLEDDSGPWLTAERLEVKWRPFALLRKRIVVDEAVLRGVHLIREPPGDGKEDDGARQITILEGAPKITISNVVFDRLLVDVNDVTHQLAGTADLRLDGPDIAIALNLTSTEDGADQADVTFEKSPQSGQFRLDAVVNGEPGGAITTLLGLEGPLHLRASGESPIDTVALTIEGVIGLYGELTADIESDFNNFDGADITANIVPGARFDGIEELAGALTLSARYDANNNGGAFTIRELSAPFATIEGHLDWRAPRGFVEKLNADLNAVLSETYQPKIQEIAGRDLNIKGVLDWRRTDYALDATVTGPLATLTLAKGRTDLRKDLTGDVDLVVAPREETQFWLQNGFTLTAQLIADFEKQAAFNNASIVTGDASRFSGHGAYGFSDKSLQLKGDLTLTPALAALALPGVTPAGDISGDIELSGPLEMFTLTTAFEAPALRINDGALPPMNVEAALSGLPRLPTGNISARASNGAPRKLDAQLRSSEDGTIRVPSFAYAGRGFELDGSAQLSPGRQTLNLDLGYEGDDDAEPWPGVAATGSATVKGVLSRDGALNQMHAAANALNVNGLIANGLNMTAEGPPGAVRITLRADRFEPTSTAALTALSASGVADLAGATKLRLNQFEALLNDNQATLTEQARFDFADGVSVDNLRLNWGRNGVIDLDGAFTKTLWRADAALSNVNIPGADGQITGEFSLDTNADTPARGIFSLRSLLLNRDDAVIQAQGVWNGETVHLTDRGDGQQLDMDVRLPVRLIRSPTLRIEAAGDIDGRISYDGDMQAVAAYLPPVLQTVEGMLSADFTLGGDFSAPTFSGRAALINGAYTEIESGFSLAALHAEAEAAYGGASSTVTFKGGAKGAGQTRTDTITFTGDITAGENTKLNLLMKLDGAELSAHPINQLRADGELSVTGPPNALKAEGDISITELDAEIVTPESTGLVDIEVVSLEGDGAAPENLAPAQTTGIEFNIHVSADDRIFIRGRGLESEWSADVNAVNAQDEPLVLGSLSLRRGWLDFSGRRFDLTRGSVSFDRLAKNNPVLDIRAEHDTGDGVTAQIVISGRADQPKVELTSTPTLPSEDVMALILFGKPAQDLSAFETIQIGEALASLSGIGPFGGEGITGRLRRAVGLDLLNVDVDPENGGGSLTVGKYVADGFFVSASQDAQGRSGSVSVKYEITDNITVETEIEQDGDQTVSANWKKDF